MPNRDKFNHKIILAVIGILLVLLCVLILITPPNLFPDPSWGFQVMRSMQAGGNFNMLMHPDHLDISKNTGEFLSWWSPGQYLAPYLFIDIFKINIGQATAIVIIIGQAIGLAGLYAFFKKAGLNRLISAVSLLFIVCQQAFFSPYIFYNGGETLLFAFIGWFLYGCLFFDKRGLKLVLFILLSGWVGFVCKSSFIWMYGAGLLFMWVRLSANQRSIKSWIVNGLWAGIPAVLSIAAIYAFYLSKGGNPSSGSYGFSITLKSVMFPLASPLLSGFSLDDLANGLMYHNDVAIFSTQAALIIVTVVAILSVLLIYTIWTSGLLWEYKLVVLIFYSTSLVFFGSAFMRQLDISYEARHFRVLGLIIIPGVIYLVSTLKLPYRLAFGIFTIFITFFSIRFYSLSYIALGTETARGPSGIAQQFIDQPSMDYITMLDKQNKDALFVFLSPDLGLEIRNNRVITLQALNNDINIDFEESVQKGHAGPVYILMPSKYIGVRANVLLKCFPGYKGFSLKELSDDYVLYFATQAR